MATSAIEPPIVFQRIRHTSRSPSIDDPYGVNVTLVLKVRVLYPDGRTPEQYGEHVTVPSQRGQRHDNDMGWVELEEWSKELKKQILEREQHAYRQDDTSSGIDRYGEDLVLEEPTTR